MAYASGALGAIFGRSTQTNLISWEKNGFEKGERFLFQEICRMHYAPLLYHQQIYVLNPAKPKYKMLNLIKNNILSDYGFKGGWWHNVF